jgi:hypothetical protein
MTRDEIYDHLAKVYLGKREGIESVQLKKQPPSWLVINVVITVFILASVFWGLTAFLTQRDDFLKSRVIFTLNNSPIRLSYNVGDGMPQTKALSIAVPLVEVKKFKRVNVSLRGLRDGNPKVLKIVLTNTKEENAVYYLQGITNRWREYSLAFEDLNLTDWDALRDISFVIEAWNADKSAGTVLIDNISFSN